MNSQLTKKPQKTYTEGKTILCGITHQNELYFIDIRKDQIHSFGVKPYHHQEAVNENLRRLVEGEYWKSAVICGRTEKKHDDWIVEVVEKTGQYGMLKLMEELTTEISGEKYVFELTWAGKDKTRLKHYFLNKDFYDHIMRVHNQQGGSGEIDLILKLWNQNFNRYYSPQKFIEKSLDILKNGSDEVYLDTFIY